MRTESGFRLLDDLERVIHVRNECDQSLHSFRRTLLPLLQGLRGAVAVVDDGVKNLLTYEEISDFARQVKKNPEKAILTAYEPRHHPYLYFAYGHDNCVRHIVSVGERQRGFRQQYPNVSCWWPALAWFPEAQRAAEVIDQFDFEPCTIKDPTQRIAFFAQFRHPSSLPCVQPGLTCAGKPHETTEIDPFPSHLNSLDMRFIRMPAGRWSSGIGPFGFHGFKVSRSFWIQNTPLTRGHWRSVMESNRLLSSDPDLPETGRSLLDVIEFIKVLNSMGLGRYRLPRAHEWEYACRAGTETDFFFDAMDGTIDDYAWYRENSGGRTHPVARKRSNPWGLFDMAGNVREYTFDTYMPGEENGGVSVDPRRLAPAMIVQVRGGGFNSRSDQLRSGHFSWVSAKEYKPNPSIGLRLVYVEDTQEDDACD